MAYSSEDAGAGGFLIPEGKARRNQPEKPTKTNSHYRPAGLMSREDCGNCVMFTPDAGQRQIGNCDLGWRAQSTYVCDHWEAKSG